MPINKRNAGFAQPDFCNIKPPIWKLACDTNEKEERLLQACKKPLKPVVITALNTGFRMSELLSLAWEDVNFGCRTIAVKAGDAKSGWSEGIDE